MSHYPAPAAGADLYAVDQTTPPGRVGTIATFSTTNGDVTAMCVRNASTASIAAGAAVRIGDAGKTGYVEIVDAASFSPGEVVGGLANSVGNSTQGGYAWAIMRGPQTNALLAATLASSAGYRCLVHNSSAGGLQTLAKASSHAHVMAILHSTASTLSADTAHGGIVEWAQLWR